MAINVADNFSYKGSKPLDARIKYESVAAMAGAATADLYDGCLAYVTATKKYYSYDSTNTTDPTTGKWREYSSGGGGGQEIQKTTLPTASESESGNIYQYVGTNAALVKGGFYECVRHGATYQWDLVDTIGITSEIRDFAMSSYTYGSCDSESDLIDALNEFESYRSELTVVSSNVFYGSCWIDTTFDDMPHGTIIKAVYDTDAGWLYKGYDPNSAMEFTIVPTGTAPDIEAITVQALAATPMPAADMSDIVTPKPGVMSRRFKYSTEEQVVGEWIDGKPIWQKVVSYGALPNNVRENKAHNISNIDLVISVSGIAYNSDKSVCISLPQVSNDSLCIRCTADKRDIIMVTYQDRSYLNSAYVTIQYTKTTD